MEQHKKDYFVNRIKNQSPGPIKRLEHLVSQINFEYLHDDIPIGDLLNGLLGWVFPEENCNTELELQSKFHIVFYMLAQAVYFTENTKQNKEKEKEKVVDFVLSSIYDIDNTKSLKEFTNMISQIKNNPLFENFSSYTLFTSF